MGSSGKFARLLTGWRVRGVDPAPGLAALERAVNEMNASGAVLYGRKVEVERTRRVSRDPCADRAAHVAVDVGECLDEPFRVAGRQARVVARDWLEIVVARLVHMRWTIGMKQSKGVGILLPPIE